MNHDQVMAGEFLYDYQHDVLFCSTIQNKLFRPKTTKAPFFRTRLP